MKKFSAVEGLRGWLAWMVVLAHLTEVVDAKGSWRLFAGVGHPAVLMFVIVSGFVITHLVIEKPEPYLLYVFRRYMRLFPLFAVTCFAGYFTSQMYASSLTRLPWANDASFAGRIFLHTGFARSAREFFWQNIVTHAVMLHGITPPQIAPFAAVVYNPPAWSVSLEWQFYLIAPFVIALARRGLASLWGAGVLALLEVAYRLEFQSEGPLIGAAGFFALGIASRIFHPWMTGRLDRPNFVLAVILVLMPLCPEGFPIFCWVAFMCGLVFVRPKAQTFARLYCTAFESPAMMYLGSRSFSTYLCHFPVLSVCLALWIKVAPGCGRLETFLALTAMVVPLTILVSELLYQSVERPGIALGVWLARRRPVSPSYLATNPDLP
jgi:peptidoglycan/LPS O-acetylase OafA/YrhL